MWICLALAAVVALALALVPTPAAAKEKTWSLGVVAGEVMSNSAILWVYANQKGEARLQIDTEPSFNYFTRVDNVHARDTTDFTVQVQVTGLQFGTIYYYCFVMGSDLSDTGRFTTALAANANQTIH